MSVSKLIVPVSASQVDHAECREKRLHFGVRVHDQVTNPVEGVVAVEKCEVRPGHGQVMELRMWSGQ